VAGHSLAHGSNVRFRNRRFLDDFSACHHDDTVGKRQKLVEVFTNQEDRHALVASGENLGMPCQKFLQYQRGKLVGRYDVRFGLIRMGEGIAILELNGAASEATNAYDSSKSLRDVYRILFQQWELVFTVGDQNRRRGHRWDSLAKFLSEWRRYQECSLCHPLAD
jgi:hypothetical protein